MLMLQQRVCHLYPNKWNNMDAQGAYHNEISELESINDARYENIFKMYIKDDKYIYNILRQVNIDMSTADPQTFDQTVIKFDMSWTAISYRVYSTTELWWLIYLSNKHTINTPLDLVPGGTKLNIIKPLYLRDIVDEITQSLRPRV